MKRKSFIRMKKVIMLLVLMIINVNTVIAQQDPQYTQYALNTMVINPAFAGSRGVSSLALLHRSQWIGLDGAPTTQTLNFNTLVSERIGLGFSIVNDEIGNRTSQETYFDASFSYTLPISDTGNLALGLKAGAHILNVDFSQLVNFGAETNLPNIDNKFSPNFGVGTYYYTENFYVGLSVPNFLETKHFDNSEGSNSFLAANRMNIYLISGYVFDLKRDVKFRPSILFKMVNGAPLQTDFSASFVFKDKFSVGAAYRLNAAVSALFGLQISNKLMAGLAYDVETTALGSTEFNDGSFEFFLRYDFITRFNRNVVKNRFF